MTVCNTIDISGFEQLHREPVKNKAHDVHIFIPLLRSRLSQCQ